MSKLQDAALQAAEMMQFASINHAPSVERDLAPATAAETKEPVVFDSSASSEMDFPHGGEEAAHVRFGIDDEDDEDEEEDDDVEIPLSLLHPLPPPRRAPPHLQLPDLRFEQSYMKSIEGARTWKGVAYITIKDQIFMPLIQGMAWTLIVAGWRHWNTATKFSGQTTGAKIRRWWWNVNNWSIPMNGKQSFKSEKMGTDGKRVYTRT